MNPAEMVLICQNAKVGGMQADLKLTSSDYSLVLSIFFVVSSDLSTIRIKC